MIIYFKAAKLQKRASSMQTGQVEKVAYKYVK